MGNNFPVSNNGAAPLEYGEGAPRLGVKTIALDTATTDKEFEFGGNVLWAPDGSDIDSLIQVKYQDQLNDAIPFQVGSFIAGPTFSRLYISWEAQAGKTITLLYTKDSASRPFRIENATSNFTGVSVAGTVDVDIVEQSDTSALLVKPSGLALLSQADVSLAATSTTLICTLNSSYRNVFITNLSTNTQILRIGDSSAGATRGTPLAPGETIVLNTISNIYGYNPGGSAQTVGVLKSYA